MFLLTIRLFTGSCVHRFMCCVRYFYAGRLQCRSNEHNTPEAWCVHRDKPWAVAIISRSMPRKGCQPSSRQPSNHTRTNIQFAAFEGSFLSGTPRGSFTHITQVSEHVLHACDKVRCHQDLTSRASAEGPGMCVHSAFRFRNRSICTQLSWNHTVALFGNKPLFLMTRKFGERDVWNGLCRPWMCQGSIDRAV